jgi:NAD(P)-dependent dehydrogenase (short-subunit alcohol dehydrogenase family)
MTDEINPRKVLVTGGSRGIGKATALRLADEGFDVAICYVSSKKEGEEVAREIRAKGVKGIAFQADLSKRAPAEGVVEKAARFLGGLDTLVNNAGIYERSKFENLIPSQWHRTISTNLDSMFFTTRAALPYMKEQKFGRIVNLTSILAHIGSSQGADYASSKAAVIGLTRSLALEFAQFGITVNAVASGSVETFIIGHDTPEVRAERIKKIPLGRVGQPEDIAGVIAFLVSKDSSYITGQTLNANGGQFML